VDAYREQLDSLCRRHVESVRILPRDHLWLVVIYGSKIKGDARLFTSAIKLGHVPLSPRSLPRTLGMIRRPVSLSGVTSGSFSISDADCDSHSFSRCGACTSTWCLMSSLLRDGCLSHLLGTSVGSSSIHPRCDQALLLLQEFVSFRHPYIPTPPIPTVSSDPGQKHMDAAEYCLKYLAGTVNLCIHYGRTKGGAKSNTGLSH
jgi:hypothetical protein